ncbi:MAG: endonuclease/exonuclease/phosphatase family protein [Candidatus Melainabacteria bacterium]
MILKTLIQFLFLLAAVGWISGAMPRQTFLLELASHFPAQYAALALLLGLLAWRVRRMSLVIMCGVTLLITLGQVLPYVLPAVLPPAQPAKTAYSKKFRVMQVNLHVSNNRYADVANNIRRENPNVVALEELSQEWANMIASELKPEYPYQVMFPREDAFGVGLISKTPVESFEQRFYGDLESIRVLPVPALVVELASPVLRIVVAHPPPPFTLRMFEGRNRYLNAMAEHAAHLGETGSVVLMGDLNMTPWSGYYRQFVVESTLKDSLALKAGGATWPSYFPPLWIPIDHVMVSDRIRVFERHTGAAAGSDHLPVIVTLSVPSVR